MTRSDCRLQLAHTVRCNYNMPRHTSTICSLIRGTVDVQSSTGVKRARVCIHFDGARTWYELRYFLHITFGVGKFKTEKETPLTKYGTAGIIHLQSNEGMCWEVPRSGWSARGPPWYIESHSCHLSLCFTQLLVINHNTLKFVDIGCLWLNHAAPNSALTQILETPIYRHRN